MAISRIKVWNDEILYPADLNAEFDNTNASATPNPFDTTVDGGNQNLTNVAGIGVNQGVVFGDAAANPSTTGQMMRNGTILKFNDGSVARVNQCLHSVGQSGLIQATDAETSLYSFMLPAGALGTLNKLQTKILFRAGLLSGSSVSILTLYGGQTGPSLGVGNGSASTAGLTLVPLVITLSANTASTQTMIIEANICHDLSNAADAFASVSPNLAQVASLTVDSTTAQAFQVNVLFSASDAANQCDYVGLTTMLIG